MTGPSALSSHTVGLLAVVLCAALWARSNRGLSARTKLVLTTGGDLASRERNRPGRLRWWNTARRLKGRLAPMLGPHWWCVPGGMALGLLARSALPLIAGLVAVPLLGRRLRAREAVRAAERTEGAVIDLCAAVAGELRAGLLPTGALLSTGARELGEGGATVLAAARYGGDVPAALRAVSRLPGAEGLRGAAACWQVAADGGTGLADGLERVAAALRAERDQREELRAQLAGPRSTALVLAVLPAFGLLLGGAMGADPLRVLFHSPAGLGCLVAGAVLEGAGLAWVARLVRVAEHGDAS